MNGTIYEEATWYDIERNKMHLKKDGEHYVADAMLLRENANLRQENDRLKKENDSLLKERDHWHVEQVHAYGNWEDARKRASELEAENVKLRELLQRTWDIFHDATAREFDDTKSKLRELGVEVD